MGGAVHVESEIGQGTVFTLVLPLGVADAPATGQSSSRHVTQKISNGHILLVDDDEINRRIVGKIIQRLGYEVSVCADGQEAVDWVAAGNAAQIILMDCQMPGMDGYSATKAIRALGYEGPVVALTADAFEENRRQCLSCGMQDVVTKPITSGRLSGFFADFKK